VGGQLEMPSWGFTVVARRRVCAIQTADLPIAGREPSAGCPAEPARGDAEAGPKRAALTWARRRRNGPITVLYGARDGGCMHQSRRAR